MSESHVGYFVYVRGMRGPSAQKWLVPPQDWRGKPPETLAVHKVSADEYALSLDELMKRYPAPEGVT